MGWIAIVPHSQCPHENDDHSHDSQSLSAWLLKSLFACTRLGTCEFVASESWCESLSLPIKSLSDLSHIVATMLQHWLLPLTEVFRCGGVCAAQVTWEVCSCSSAQSLVLGQCAGWRHPARVRHWLGTSSWLHWKGRLCVFRNQVLFLLPSFYSGCLEGSWGDLFSLYAVDFAFLIFSSVLAQFSLLETTLIFQNASIYQKVSWGFS